MSFFNSNITGASGSGGAAGGLVTKFEKTITIGANELAEVVINLADDISNYADITNEQIIVELKRVSASLTSNSGYADLSHSYNAVTGDLTITSTTSLMPFRNPSDMEIGVDIYVAGAVQLPPVPESVVYDLGTGTTFNVKGFPNYQSLTVNNFIVGVQSMPSAQADYSGNNRMAEGTGFSLTKKYDNLNGVLTISGNTQLITYNTRECSATQVGSVRCYLVLGEIQ